MTDGAGDLERWAADARAREMADARVRERWLRAQAEEESSLAGVLLALAERRETVLLTTVAGRRYRGAVLGVGKDFAAVETPAGPTTLIALAVVGDVRVVREGPGRGPAATGAGGELGVRLVDVLAQAAGQRPRVSVQAGAAAVVGDLRAVGSDVLTIRADGDAGVVYVGLGSLSEVSFLASG
ncbi:MAG TPA: hypothetical protein VJ653_06235 [Acidimicrobiales bacterium]|nr:hypothetical protein [Acidimicrobiales bacterium]